MRSFKGLTFCTIVMILGWTSALPAQWTFTPLGQLPGGNLSNAYGISDDGLFVAGVAVSASGTEGTFWSDVTGLIGIGDLPGGGFSSRATGITADGELIVGVGQSALGDEAITWSLATGFVGYGDLPGGVFQSEFRGASSDGSVLFGAGNSASGQEAMYWTQQSGLVGIGDLAGGIFKSKAQRSSADGMTLVGFGTSASGQEAMYWTEATGMVGLGDLPGGSFKSNAFDVSDDGSVIVGTGATELGREAMVWTQATGMVGLGDFPDGVSESVARGVNGDGSIIVGWGTTATGKEAAIWDSVSGMQNLRDLLISNGVTNLDGWLLTEAYKINPDGSAIIGNGINPDGISEAWIVRFNAPTATSERLAIADDGNDRVYDYDPIDGTSLGDTPLASGNNSPRGIASDANGRTWHIDNDDFVYAYDAAGNYMGKWKAKGLRYPEGIAVAGDDVLIVDRGYDKVFIYEGGANWLDNANHYPSDSWSLNSSKGNRSPRGITTDGTTVWIVNSAGTDRIYKYSIDGNYEGRSTLDAGNGNKNPRGVAISVDGLELYVVDVSSRRVYLYPVNHIGGASLDWFPLNSSNTNPQGVANVVLD